MQRLKDHFLETLESRIPLKELSILEIGSGNGARSIAIAGHCKNLVGIEPDPVKVATAVERIIPNAEFRAGTAESLPFPDESFDMVIFALSLHHVPIDKMADAINEAIRVTKHPGSIVFLEPALEGSYFEAEIQFDAGDGDERMQKNAAYQAITNHEGLHIQEEIDDETAFSVDSVEDFTEAMEPKKDFSGIALFLDQNNRILTAKRRIHICDITFVQ